MDSWLKNTLEAAINERKSFSSSHCADTSENHLQRIRMVLSKKRTVQKSTKLKFQSHCFTHALKEKKTQKQYMWNSSSFGVCLEI
jgi:alpha-amylase/alpha-mannosidase (GH57 family)